ncbi:MAG TPA: baseplate J/gp47 family protein [Candidatus Acidoferrales bacterium]|nr:baseplate J/gp47 family protein [Candidatus Acidoferrales bacterium]
MAAEPIYIESDEELPEVIERLRRSPSQDVPLVLPARSRLGQSRFNFQLLSEYATKLNKRVSIVSSDPAVQEMAAESGLGGSGGVTALPSLGTSSVPPAPAVAVAPLMVAAGDLEAGSVAPAATPPRIRLSGGAVQHWSAARPSRVGLYVGALLILVAGLLGIIFYVPSASVTLVAQAKPFSTAVTVEAAPGGGPVAVRTSLDSQTATTSFPATGTFTTPATHATATVEVTNNCHPNNNFTFSAGQDFSTAGPGSVLFTIPPGTPDQSVSPGPSVPISVTAVDAGPAGNVPAGSITQISGSNAGACLAASNPGAASGGADPTKSPQISATDLQGAQATMNQNLRRQIAADLTKQAKSDEKLSDAVVFQPASFAADHAQGDKVAKFNVTMTLKGEGAFYKPAQVQTAFASALAQKIPAGQQMTGSAPTATYTTTGTAGGHLTFTGTLNTNIAHKLDLQQVKSQLVAKSVSQARANLGKLPVNSAKIDQSPFNLPWMPLLESRIKVSYVVSQTPAASAPAT